MFQSLEGFMVDGNSFSPSIFDTLQVFQSLEGFMVDGNQVTDHWVQEITQVSIPRRVYGWWERLISFIKSGSVAVSIPRRVYGWWERSTKSMYNMLS